MIGATSQHLWGILKNVEEGLPCKNHHLPQVIREELVCISVQFFELLGQAAKSVSVLLDHVASTVCRTGPGKGGGGCRGHPVPGPLSPPVGGHPASCRSFYTDSPTSTPKSGVSEVDHGAFHTRSPLLSLSASAEPPSPRSARSLPRSTRFHHEVQPTRAQHTEVYDGFSSGRERDRSRLSPSGFTNSN